MSSLPAEVEAAAYRLVQEGLTNAMKHAPGSEVRLRLTAAADRLEVELSNRGGSAPAAVAQTGAGLGLVGMRERVEALGGRFEAGAGERRRMAPVRASAHGLARLVRTSRGEATLARGGDETRARRRLTGRRHHAQPKEHTMELIAMILVAGPLGYFCRTRTQGLGLYLVIWAVIFPIQTWIVLAGKETDDPVYWILNAVFLAGGVGLNAFGAQLRMRRADGLDEHAAAEA